MTDRDGLGDVLDVEVVEAEYGAVADLLDDVSLDGHALLVVQLHLPQRTMDVAVDRVELEGANVLLTLDVSGNGLGSDEEALATVFVAVACGDADPRSGDVTCELPSERATVPLAPC